MKVAMVTPYWFPVRGGLTSYVSSLTDALRKYWAIKVYIIAREGEPNGATIIGGTSREFVARAARELDRIEPDAIHAHGHWYALSAALRHKRRRSEVRVVFTIHTQLDPELVTRRLVLARLLSKANTLTAVSQDLLARTSEAYRISVRTRVTPPGVLLRTSSPEQTRGFQIRYELLDRRPIVAFVGPLTYERKCEGIRQLIAAMTTIRSRFPGSVLVIAGDGSYRAGLEAHATRKVPGGVTFLGDVPDPTPLLLVADVYAHISFQEGLPLALLEAMAAGKAIVASRVGGIPEVIRDGENGFLVDGDSTQIADRILRLLASETLASRFGSQSLRDVSSLYGPRQCAERFVPLYGGKLPRKVVVSVDLERDYPGPQETHRGLEEAVPKLLDLFRKHGVTANFFATSDLSTRYADVLRQIVREGHGLGCHGESHSVSYLSARSFDWQLESIKRATESIQTSTGIRPRGFRAPNFSANGSTIRALKRLGYWYDSSVLPGRRVRKLRTFTLLDTRPAPSDPYRPSQQNVAVPGTSGVIEFPVTENPMSPGGPISLGFLHTAGLDQTLEAIATSASDVCVFLIHPWELLDPPDRRVPKWMLAGCRSDSTLLDGFLKQLKVDHELTTFEAQLEKVHFLPAHSEKPAMIQALSVPRPGLPQ